MKFEINVRYNIGDEVYTIKDNRVRKVVIDNINVYIGKESTKKVTYYDKDYKSYQEADCYDTQEELWEAIKCKEG